MSEERKVQSDEMINRTPNQNTKKEVRTNETLSKNRSEFSKGSTLPWQINFFQKTQGKGKPTQAPEEKDVCETK